MSDLSPAPRPSPSARRLSRLVGVAKAADFWERLWRGIVPPFVVSGCFASLSWLGLWLEMPHWARAVGVGLFGLALGAACWGFRHLAPLSRAGALRRIDKASGVAHRPASILDDRLASAGRDPATAALWALHQRRAEAETGRLRAGRPSPRAADLDRYAVRAAMVVALIACALIAGPQRYARIAAAFDFGEAGPGGPGYRLDAWIDPPPYTGRPPILLDLASDKARDTRHPQTIAAPDGSVVIIRTSGRAPAEIEATGPLLPPPPKQKTEDKKPDDKQADQGGAAMASPPGTTGAPPENETRLVLRGDSQLALRHGGLLRGIFNLAAIADKPPTISLSEVPKANARGSLTLAYEVGDDYGVSRAEATFSGPKINGEPAAGPSLVPPPKVDLSLPGMTNGIGEGETTADLSDHAWAGATVTMTLIAHDEGGNEGRSEPVEITLPQKPFTNPVARALVEQRRNLVLNPGSRADVGAALDAMMVAPDEFGTTAAVYLGLRFAADSLAHAEDNKQLLEVADFLWGMAQYLENGDLSDSERALRQAEKDLRDAIDRKASDEEIQKLTQNLQAAMDKFLKELAEQQQKQGPQQAQNQGKPSKTVSQRDLQALIDRLKQQARSGNREEAKKALDELQDILENLKTAKRQQADPQARAMAEGLNQLDQMMRDQQDLRDETFKNGQQGQQQGQQQGDSSPGQQGGEQQDGRPGRSGQRQPGREGQGRMGGEGKTLGQRQQELRDRLGQIQKKLKQAGEGQDPLDDAGKDMRDAEQALHEGKGSNDQAVDAQGKALDALRNGAKKLADAMQQQGEQNGEGNGEKDGSQGSQQGQQTEDADPLGRPRGGTNTLNSSSRFNPLGIPAAQRAQRVLEELRRRLADPLRTQEEIDYLERLLHSY